MQAFLIGRLTKRWSDDGLLLTSLSVAAVALTVWGFAPTVVAGAALIAYLTLCWRPGASACVEDFAE